MKLIKSSIGEYEIYENIIIDRFNEGTDLNMKDVTSIITIPIMFIYGLSNAFIKANYLLFALILLSVTGLIVGWCFLRHFRNGRIIYRINALLFSLLILYLLLIGGESGSKILWMYTFPLISFFLFGKNEGLFWSVAVILIAVILLWNPFNLLIAYDYPNELITRFMITYLIVSAIMYWSEYFRYRHRIDVELKNQILRQEITERKQAEEKRKKVINELQEALDNIKTLKGLLPICASCKKIRDDKGCWNYLETYIERHSDASFSHGMCPKCSDELYGKEDWYIEMKKKRSNNKNKMPMYLAPNSELLNRG